MTQVIKLDTAYHEKTLQEPATVPYWFPQYILTRQDCALPRGTCSVDSSEAGNEAQSRGQVFVSERPRELPACNRSHGHNNSTRTLDL